MPNAAPAATKADRVVFTCGTDDFTVRDVIDAAHLRGELDRLWRDLLTRVAAEEKAQQSGAELDQQAMNATAVAFRYKHDLITAEETEKWLEQRAVTLGDYSDYFVRDYWAKIFGARATAAATPYIHATPEQRELLVTELTFSGQLDQLGKRFASRVAAFCVLIGDEIPHLLVDEENQQFRSRVANVEEWLAGLGRDEAWLQEMLQMETAYQNATTRILTPEARQRELSALRLPLTRCEIELIELESHGAAREAFLCVRDDGMTMEEVAKEGRYPYRRIETVLDQLEPEMQQKYLSAIPGTVMEPIARGDGYQLTRLLGKREPSLEDREVGTRVEQRLLARHFGDLTASRIQWKILSD